MDELREKLASIDHDQWMYWAKNMMLSGEISEERKARWLKFMVPYSELDEDVKEDDRVWADKVIAVLNESYILRSKISV